MLPRNQLQEAVKVSLRKKQNRAKTKVSRHAQHILFVFKSASWTGLCEVKTDKIEGRLVPSGVNQHSQLLSSFVAGLVVVQLTEGLIFPVCHRLQHWPFLSGNRGSDLTHSLVQPVPCLAN